MIYFIIAFAFVLRLIKIDQSLWLDEAINVLAAKDLAFWQLITGYSLGDFHPPGYFSILWIWIKLFGNFEFAVRLPSILFGVGTVWLVYLIGKQLVSQRFGLIASLLLGINPLAIYYSQEARMYCFAAFAGTLATYFLIRLIKNGGVFILLYGLSVGLLLYSDYLVYFLIPSHLVYVIWVEKQKVKALIIGLTVGGLLISPWLMIFPSQLQAGRQTAESVPGWEKVVGGSNIKNLLLVFIKSVIGRITLDSKLLYTLMLTPIGLFYSLIILKNLEKLDKNNKLFLCWVFIPILLAFLISFFIPILSYFRMIFIIPGLCLLTAHGIYQFSDKWKKIYLSALILISSICLIIFWTNPKFQREDWKGLMKFIKQSVKEDGLVLFEDSNLPAPIQYYKTSNKSKVLLAAIKNFPANMEEDIVNLDGSVTTTLETIYLVNYLVEISDPNRLVDQKLTELGFSVIKTHNFNGVGFVYEYTR